MGSRCMPPVANIRTITICFVSSSHGYSLKVPGVRFLLVLLLAATKHEGVEV